MSLLTQAETIRDETIPRANTATRVGTLLVDIANDMFDGTVVKSLSDFPTPVDGVITLSGAYIIQGAVNIGTNRIVLSGDTQLIGLNERTDQLIYTGVGTAITGVGHSFSTKFLSYIATTGTMFDLTGTSEKFVYGLSCGFFSCATVGTFTTFRFATFKLSRFNGCGSIKFAGSIGKALISDSPFEQATDTEIVYLDGFDGGVEVRGNWFFDDGGQYIEVENAGDTQLALITDNRFSNTTATSNFIGFTESTIGFIVKNNVSQIDSGAFLDAKFTSNTTPQTVTTAWSDVNTEFTVLYSQRFSYDALTKSFVYNGIRDNLLRAKFSYYIESASNSQDLEIGLFQDTGSGFELVANSIFPYSFRFADATNYLEVAFRLVVVNATKFKLMARKPSGSSSFTFLSGQAVV